MQPKDNSFEKSHGELFRSSLEQMLNREHPLYVLCNKIDWKRFDRSFGNLFAQKQGRPALPTRLVVGLHYLKHAFNEGDESVVARLLVNPYWQYFCGFINLKKLWQKNGQMSIDNKIISVSYLRITANFT